MAPGSGGRSPLDRSRSCGCSSYAPEPLPARYQFQVLCRRQQPPCFLENLYAASELASLLFESLAASRRLFVYGGLRNFRLPAACPFSASHHKPFCTGAESPECDVVPTLEGA